jgi:hypothetical protein
MVAAGARTGVAFALSPGNAHDAQERRALLEDLGPMPEGPPMLMDKVYASRLPASDEARSHLLGFLGLGFGGR